MIRLISAAMNIGQTVTNSTDCKVYARTTAESVKIAVKTSTAPHGLKTASRQATVRHDSQGRRLPLHTRPAGASLARQWLIAHPNPALEEIS